MHVAVHHTQEGGGAAQGADHTHRVAGQSQPMARFSCLCLCMQQDVNTLPLAPSHRAKLAKAGFLTVADILELQPLDLAEGISLDSSDFALSDHATQNSKSARRRPLRSFRLPVEQEPPQAHEHFLLPRLGPQPSSGLLSQRRCSLHRLRSKSSNVKSTCLPSQRSAWTGMTCLVVCLLAGFSSVCFLYLSFRRRHRPDEDYRILRRAWRGQNAAWVCHN